MRRLTLVVVAVLIGAIALPGGLSTSAEARRKRTYVYRCSSKFASPSLTITNTTGSTVSGTLTSYNYSGVQLGTGPLPSIPAFNTGVLTGGELTVLKANRPLIVSGHAGANSIPIKCVP
jgi:hypothetical protein